MNKPLMSFKDLLQKSFLHLKKDFKGLFILFALAAIPDFLISILEIIPQNKQVELISTIIIIISIILTIWIIPALIVKIDNPRMRIEQAFYKGWSMFFQTFWVSLILFIVLTAAYILFIIPGIVYTVYFSLAFYFLILKNKRGWNALHESKKAVTGKWWPLCGRLLGLTLLIGIPLLALLGIDVYISTQLLKSDSITYQIVSTIIIFLYIMCVEIYSYIFNYYIFKNLESNI